MRLFRRWSPTSCEKARSRVSKHPSRRRRNSSLAVVLINETCRVTAISRRNVIRGYLSIGTSILPPSRFLRAVISATTVSSESEAKTAAVPILANRPPSFSAPLPLITSSGCIHRNSTERKKLPERGVALAANSLSSRFCPGVSFTLAGRLARAGTRL